MRKIINFSITNIAAATRNSPFCKQIRYFVNQLNQRLSELHRLGFTRCLIPRSGTQSLHAPEGLELLRVRNIREAMAVAL